MAIFQLSELAWRSGLSGLTIVMLMLTVLTTSSHAAEIRLALVIGNDDYKSGKLATPASDAGLVAEALTAAGFTVTGARNLDQATLRETFREFLGQVAAGPDAVSVIYLAGYGVQLAGENYFVPTGAELPRDVDVPLAAIRVSDFMQPPSPPPVSGPVPVMVKPLTSPSPPPPVSGPVPVMVKPLTPPSPPPPVSGPVPATVKPSTPPSSPLTGRPTLRSRRALPAKRLPRSTVIRRVNDRASLGARSHAHGFRMSQRGLAALSRSS
jgi:hypothetical protein